MKRPSPETSASGPAKKGHTNGAAASFFKPRSEQSRFRWLEPVGETKSCLHGVCDSPPASAKVAAFDVDGTLIHPKVDGKKRRFPKDAYDFQFWHSRDTIKSKLEQLHADGYTILLLTNQLWTRGNGLKFFEDKMPMVARSLDGIPFRIFAAVQRDRFRKPLTGMWDIFVERFNNGIVPDLSQSFYVGDAAGRLKTSEADPDWNDTDRKLAYNIGIPFHTPEEFFLGQPVRSDWQFGGYDAALHDHDLPVWHPSTTPLVPPAGLGPEVVLFCGSPGVGKTSFYRTHFQPRGYVHVNQDTLGSREKCLDLVNKSLSAGKSCVVDNTNPARGTRQLYIDMAAAHHVPIRLCHFAGGTALGRHNNVYRACYAPSNAAGQRAILPDVAFQNFNKSFEEPSVDEGFAEIKTVNFVFTDGGEEALKMWSRWLTDRKS